MEKSRDELAKEYGTSVMSSMFTPTIDDYFRTTVQCGLVYDISWLSGLVHTADGTQYVMFRAYQKNSSSKFYLVKIDPKTGPAPVTSPRYTGYIWFDKPEDGKILIKSYDEGDSSFQIDIEPGKFRWQDGDDIDLHYTSLGPAMRFLTLGGPKFKEEVFYTAEMCKIEGTVNGEKVTGFGSLDQAWLNAGVAWHQNKLYLCIEDIWIPFMNKYTDGTYEYGHFIKGRQGWSLGYFVHDGVAHMNNDFTMDINWKDGNPTHVDMKIDGHDFTWRSDAIMNAPENSRPHITYAAGTMIHHGVGKELESHQSWIEYRPEHMWATEAKRI